MMPEFLTILAAGASLAWFWLLLFRNDFWRADQILDPGIESLEFPAVVAVVPARNEADVIARTVASLVRQDYPGEFNVLLVDDQSDDGTGARVRNSVMDDRLTILSAPPLEGSWTGKLWVMNHGTEEATRRFPDHRYILYTDADIEHSPENLRQLVSHAERDRRDLVSLMARLHCDSVWERLLVPAFVFFFQKLYPFPAVNDDRSRVAAAAGGCMLVRRQKLDQAEGLYKIRSALIDDCALANLIKEKHGRLWLGLAGDNCRSVRPYKGISGIWNMVARTAFAQLGYSWINLAATLAGMLLLYLCGPAIFLTYPSHSVAIASSLGLLAWLLMSCTFIPTLLHYRQSVLLSATLPISGTLYALMTLSSAWCHAFQGGSEWKGRTYSARGNDF